MQHQHIFEQGRCTICSQTEKIYQHADSNLKANSNHDGHDHNHDESTGAFGLFKAPLLSLIALLIAIVFDNFISVEWFTGWIRVVWYIFAYVPVGFPVLKDAVKSIGKGNVYSEFFLMGIATLGAFAIGEYPEAVAVMLFYAVGEGFQTLAVSRAKSNIKALLDQRPDEATIIVNNEMRVVPAKKIEIGAIIHLKPGEKLALDGVLVSDRNAFNTSALTGESQPDTKKEGDVVLAGMINLNTLAQVRVTAAFEDSKLSKILELVQDASAQKAPTELFISKFAKIYTPIVVYLAIAITVLPILWVEDYVFTDWLYRALVFLVISCPCALVISIPLGYFGGIGAASKNGILVKGSNFLDILASIRQVVMDKTGTLTAGVFSVQEIVFEDPSKSVQTEKKKILDYVNLIEKQSTHPVATAIHAYVGPIDSSLTLTDFEEIAGHGLKGIIEGREVLVGNFKLMDRYSVNYPIDPASIIFTTIAIAIDQIFVGYITIADQVKEDAEVAISSLHALGIRTAVLSGDKSNVVQNVAQTLGIDEAFGDLLPANKVEHVRAMKSEFGSVAFVGDGVNDAPVVAISDVGIAMGGLGSDATIETADVVIQDDKPSKIPIAIQIGQKTRRIVWQNIGLAFGVKLIVLILGAGGLATMWEAVFADVGVALLAILNASRIANLKF